MRVFVEVKVNHERTPRVVASERGPVVGSIGTLTVFPDDDSYVVYAPGYWQSYSVREVKQDG